MKKLKFLIPVLIIFATGCAGIHYNQAAQDQNRQIQVLTDETIDRAVQKYEDNTALAQALKDAYASAVAFEQKRGKTNFPTVSMWKQIDQWVNTEFVTTWQKQGTISVVGSQEIKKRADKLFDYIITLEENKIK